MLRSARALLAAAAAPRHVLALLGADVDCPCRRHDHPRQNALVNYAGCRPGAHSGHPASCGCWWPLESSGAETSLLHDHAERHVLWRLSRGSHAAVHALMQRSSSRASSERDDSSRLPSRDTAAHACSQSDCSENAESSSESAERLLSKRTLSLSRLGDKEDILRQANKCTSMIDRSVDYATIIST